MNQSTPGPWKLETFAWGGYCVSVVGKIPFVASAGVATPNHAVVVAEEFRSVCTTGFTEAEVVANGRLIAKAPEMRERVARMTEFLQSIYRLKAVTGGSIEHEIASGVRLLAEIDGAEGKE